VLASLGIPPFERTQIIQSSNGEQGFFECRGNTAASLTEPTPGFRAVPFARKALAPWLRSPVIARPTVQTEFHLISSRPARAARDVDLLNRQKARESQSHGSTIPSPTVLTNHLPIIVGKSHQLSSRERGQRCPRTARRMRALPDALPCSFIVCAARASSGGLAVRTLTHRKKINVKRVNC
jgi:hypothetical protein